MSPFCALSSTGAWSPSPGIKLASAAGKKTTLQNVASTSAFWAGKMQGSIVDGIDVTLMEDRQDMGEEKSSFFYPRRLTPWWTQQFLNFRKHQNHLEKFPNRLPGPSRNSHSVRCSLRTWISNELLAALMLQVCWITFEKHDIQMTAAFSSKHNQHAQLTFSLLKSQSNPSELHLNSRKLDGMTHLSTLRIQILKDALSARKLLYGAMIPSPFRIIPFLPYYMWVNIWCWHHTPNQGGLGRAFLFWGQLCHICSKVYWTQHSKTQLIIFN